jgi:hypothetical protein
MGMNLRSAPAGPLFLGENQNDVILWDVATRSWVVGPIPGGGGGVTSWNARTGAVVPETGDYDSDQVDNVSNADGASVSDALDSVLSRAGSPVRANKGMTASTTTADDDLACATVVATTPSASSTAGGGIGVRVNGVAYRVGDGSKAADCYFSADGGTTARLLRSVIAGDLLYWVGSVALFQLDAATDQIDFDYSVST